MLGISYTQVVVKSQDTDQIAWKDRREVGIKSWAPPTLRGHIEEENLTENSKTSILSHGNWEKDFGGRWWPTSNTPQGKERTRKHMLDLTIWRSLVGFGLFNLTGLHWRARLNANAYPCGFVHRAPQVTLGVDQFNAVIKCHLLVARIFFGFSQGFFHQRQSRWLRRQTFKLHSLTPRPLSQHFLTFSLSRKGLLCFWRCNGLPSCFYVQSNQYLPSSFSVPGTQQGAVMYLIYSLQVCGAERQCYPVLQKKKFSSKTLQMLPLHS